MQEFSLPGLIDGFSTLDPNCIVSALALAEVLLNKKVTRPIGKKILDSLAKVFESNGMEDYSRLNILYAAYHIDRKELDQAIEYILPTKNDWESLPPWQIEDTKMAYRLLTYICKATQDQQLEEVYAEKLKNAETLSEQFPWAKKLTYMAAPVWRYEIQEYQDLD